MSKYIVVTFADETKAYQGLSAFKDLHLDGSISLYSTLVVQRDASGKLVTKERTPGEAIHYALRERSTTPTSGRVVGSYGGTQTVEFGAWTAPQPRPSRRQFGVIRTFVVAIPNRIELCTEAGLVDHRLRQRRRCDEAREDGRSE